MMERVNPLLWANSMVANHRRINAVSLPCLVLLAGLGVVGCGAASPKQQIKIFSRYNSYSIVGSPTNRTYIVDEAHQQCYVQSDGLIMSIDCGKVPSEQLAATTVP